MGEFLSFLLTEMDKSRGMLSLISTVFVGEALLISTTMLSSIALASSVDYCFFGSFKGTAYLFDSMMSSSIRLLLVMKESSFC